MAALDRLFVSFYVTLMSHWYDVICSNLKRKNWRTFWAEKIEVRLDNPKLIGSGVHKEQFQKACWCSRQYLTLR